MDIGRHFPPPPPLASSNTSIANESSLLHSRAVNPGLRCCCSCPRASSSLSHSSTKPQKSTSLGCCRAKQLEMTSLVSLSHTLAMTATELIIWLLIPTSKTPPNWIAVAAASAVVDSNQPKCVGYQPASFFLASQFHLVENWFHPSFTPEGKASKRCGRRCENSGGREMGRNSGRFMTRRSHGSDAIFGDGGAR